MHKVVIARSREVRGPDGMEMGIAAVVIALVTIMATGFGVRLLPMVRTLDAVSLASGAAYNEIIHHAVHGRWPQPGDPSIISRSSRGAHVENLTLGAGGVITARLALGPVPAVRATPSAGGTDTRHGALSFRPELLGSRDAPTITFLCGHAPPVVDPSAVSGTNLTTLDRQALPPFCR